MKGKGIWSIRSLSNILRRILSILQEREAMLLSTIKNNGCEMDGLVIMEKGKDIAPTIYLEGFYEEYTRGEDIRNIIRQIETVYEENKNNVTFDVNILKQFETIKDKIVYKVVN